MSNYIEVLVCGIAEQINCYLFIYFKICATLFKKSFFFLLVNVMIIKQVLLDVDGGRLRRFRIILVISIN